MEKYRLELYKKYGGLLKKAFPSYTEKQLIEYFEIRVDFWEVIADNIAIINISKVECIKKVYNKSLTEREKWI